ncbi:hypothetical protein TEA_026938 [Camellia sinensis var. sinensis]|uniref:Malectin domain-containing protein n=1 Tax=Camellia sinensis var. sinensis TaxID=542762 RepID=A0A4S4DQZ9_CAMSN|nr:hypothetical protein TEA_026938 [Camellia sinensis var. sinensis]
MKERREKPWPKFTALRESLNKTQSKGIQLQSTATTIVKFFLALQALAVYDVSGYFFVSDLSSFHINCGGSKVVVDGKTYEEDTNSAGPSRLFVSQTNWAFSNTGEFLFDHRPLSTYIWTNTSRLSMQNSELYMDARLSPLSLTYYGFCLQNGNYTVSLHFAEIMFTNDKTYASLGRRIFDVYVQEMMPVLMAKYFCIRFFIDCSKK